MGKDVAGTNSRAKIRCKINSTRTRIKPGSLLLASLATTTKNHQMTIALCSIALGLLLTKVLPTGVVPGTKYSAPTEADFQLALSKRGLA
jgi:hypothetical protein